MLFNWPKYLPQIAPSRGEISTAFNTWFFGPTRLSLPNGISIDSAVFAGLMNVPNRQRDRQRYSICNHRPHLAITVMRPKTHRKQANEKPQLFCMYILDFPLNSISIFIFANKFAPSFPCREIRVRRKVG